MTPSDFRDLQCRRRPDPVDGVLSFAAGFCAGLGCGVAVGALVLVLLGRAPW